MRGPEDYSQFSERDLVLAFKAGDSAAQNEIYQRYRVDVYSVCRRMLGNHHDVEEAVQETFIGVYRGLPHLGDNDRLGAWIARIATNVCLGALHQVPPWRAEPITPDLEDRHSGAADVDTSDPLDLVIRGAEASRIRKVLEGLPPLYRAALVLRDYEGLTHREIADALNINSGQAKALLHRARRNFRAAWQPRERLPRTADPLEELRLELDGSQARLVLTVDPGLTVRMPAGQILDVLRRSFSAVARLGPAVYTFEELVESPGVREHELQGFLEEYPEFLMGYEYVEARPHVVLETQDGDLIPDFVLKPTGRDLWDLVELKLPNAPLLTMHSGRPQLTRGAAAAVSQLRSYAEALSDRTVRERLSSRYGINVFRPRLQIIMGRSRNVESHHLARALDAEAEIITWDVLLARARKTYI